MAEGAGQPATEDDSTLTERYAERVEPVPSPTSVSHVAVISDALHMESTTSTAALRTRTNDCPDTRDYP